MGSQQEHCGSQTDSHHVAGLYMPGLAPSTTFGSGHGRCAQQLVERFDKEILAPHHTFIDPEVLALVVAAVLEDSFPAWCIDREELGREKRVQDGPGVVVIPRRPRSVFRQRRKL